MSITVQFAVPEELGSWRELYRAEMNCQIVHDSLHRRKGWTQSYKLSIDQVVAAYGSIAIGGPWAGKPAVFEFYPLRHARHRSFDLFFSFIATSKPVSVEAQSNDPFLIPMLHLYARKAASESILFHDAAATGLALPNAVFRPAESDDATRVISSEREPGSDWLIELEGEPAATGGLLFHYNPPYADLWYEVNEPFRRRGVGAYLVQELKRICLGMGRIPAARCNPSNVASRRTLQKAGFAPCGHILKGEL